MSKHVPFPSVDQLTAELLQIDHVQMLRCHDGYWRLALMHGTEVVTSPTQAKIGDSAAIALMLREAAEVISSQEKNTGNGRHGT